LITQGKRGTPTESALAEDSKSGGERWDADRRSARISQVRRRRRSDDGGL
jgi:hypothetical protein